MRRDERRERGMVVSAINAAIHMQNATNHENAKMHAQPTTGAACLLLLCLASCLSVCRHNVSNPVMQKVVWCRKKKF